MRKITVFTGGSGLLGNEMGSKTFPNCFPTRKELDFSSETSVSNYFKNNNFDTLVHMGATTNTTGIEKDPLIQLQAIKSNIIGTANLAAYCLRYGRKMIYVSTDYVFEGTTGNYKEDDALSPFNKYGWSKLGGECSVRMLENYVIVRTSFCANEFPYPKAFSDQYSSRISVSEFATRLKLVIISDFKGVIHIGGKKQTIYDLAKQLSPEKDIIPISVKDIEGYPLPKDTSLNTEKYDKLFSKLTQEFP